ncbi:MAG: Uma2 family endonuclease [Bryobacterales bacterium]|nr:Uma2 family endonuclease [Bryobacterales bacterium]
MAAPLPTRITPEQYLESERKATVRHEYWLGEIIAMSGATRTHEVICSNLSKFTQIRLGDRDCQVYGSNMKVGVTKKRGFSYPDITIACAEQRFFDEVEDVLMNPVVIFEVVSDSTLHLDIGPKLGEYLRMESLRHYITIEQKIRIVNHWERAGDRWMFETLDEEQRVLRLAAIDIELPLTEIYRRVALPEIFLG